MLAISDIVSTAAGLLEDPDFETWSASELCTYANEGIATLVRRVPSSYATVEVIDLQPGYKQTIPATGFAFIGVNAAFDADGNPISAVTRFDRATMNAVNPGWVAETPGDMRQWGDDPRTPRVFYSYPPQPAVPGKAEIEYSLTPQDLPLDGEIEIDDIWRAAVLDFVLHRAYAKESSYASNPQLAAAHYASFVEATGGTPA